MPNYPDNISWIKNKIILLTIVGSHSYGLNTPTSDIDTRGICLVPKQYLLGLNRFEAYHSYTDDTVIYSLEKFVRLALQNNPNIIDTLFTPEDMIVEINDIGRSLLNIQDKFLSQQLYYTYGGYAKAQLHKMISRGGKGTHGVRDDLIAETGYDQKNAMHLIRLLLVACEALETNIVNVKRPDREFLLDIRNGKYSAQYILDKADELEERMAKAKETTILPEHPDRKYVNDWLIKIQEENLSK